MARVTVLEVGPRSVRVLSGGRTGHPVDPALVRSALDWIDDPVGLYEDRPVAVADLWRTVMSALAGDACNSLVVVHPDDWPPHRIDRVVAAANAIADDVLAVRHGDWRPVDLDVPSEEPMARRPGRRRKPVAATVAVVAVLLLVAAIIALPGHRRTGDPGTADTTAVVEGRIEVHFPTSWNIVRVTAGPGSRRLQATSPGDPDLAVHITQSYAPESTLAQAAAVLRREIAAQPPGVFVDFDADAEIGGLPAVGYREIRPGRVVEWTVLLVGSSRIGVGCQSPPGRADEVRSVCRQAAVSAKQARPF